MMNKLNENNYLVYKEYIFNIFLAILSSLWLLPFVIAMTLLLSAEYSDFETKSTTLSFLRDFLAFLGVIWFSIVWLIWSFLLIKRLHNHSVKVQKEKKIVKVIVNSILSAAWVPIWGGYGFLYCTIRMTDMAKEHVSSGANVFHIVRSGLFWACILLFVVLYKFFVLILKKL